MVRMTPLTVLTKKNDAKSQKQQAVLVLKLMAPILHCGVNTIGPYPN